MLKITNESRRQKKRGFSDIESKTVHRFENRDTTNDSDDSDHVEMDYDQEFGTMQMSPKYTDDEDSKINIIDNEHIKYLSEFNSGKSEDSSAGTINIVFKKTRTSYDTNEMHMNSIIEEIKKMQWGEKIHVSNDQDATLHLGISQKKCTITKVIRYRSYIFCGNGSKNISKYFMDKTKNDEKYGFKKIVQIMSDKGVRRFIPIRNWEELWKCYLDEPICYRYLFELIRSDQPCKPYLDIEWIEKIKDPRETNYSKFISKLSHDIIHIFKTRYKIKISKKSIMVSTSHSSKKVSFHIVINSVIDGNTVAFRTNKKNCSDSAWDLYIALIEYDKSYESTLDGAVYTTDREFRMLYSNKKTEFRPFVPYGKRIKKKEKKTIVPLDTEQCLKYIVTYSPNDMYHYISTPDVDLEEYAGYNYLDTHTNVPKICTNKKLLYVLSLVQTVHPTAEYTGMNGTNEGWRFSYRDKTEACYTGNYHESNGFYAFEDTKTKTIYMKCMSSQCKGRKILGNVETRVKNISKKLF
jgi:hypothetical protein